MLRLAALSLALFVPSQALALSCANGPTHTFPEDGTTEVPTNAVVRVTYLWDTPDNLPISLVDDAGQVVETELVQVSAGDAGETVWALEPSAHLAPLSTYSVQTSWDLEEPWTLSSFTTGDSADDILPEAPVVLDVRRDRGHSMWGSWLYNEILVVPPDEPMMYEVDVASSADFADGRTVQVVGWLDDDRIVVSVGNGLCGGAVDLDSSDRHLRIRAIDLAGNMSVDEVQDKISGCSSAATPAGGLAVLLGLLAVGMRRRRR